MPALDRVAADAAAANVVEVVVAAAVYAAAVVVVVAAAAEFDAKFGTFVAGAALHEVLLL